MSSSREQPPGSVRGRTVRGPLPPGVYWRRRVFVLSLAATLVFVIASVLSGGSDGESAESPAARQAGAEVQATETVTAPTRPATRKGKGKKRRSAAPPTPTLAAPQGVCDAADVVITPAVGASATAGRDVTVALRLQTRQAEACTWRVSPRSVVVKVAQDKKGLWSTRHCPRVVPRQDVVVRRAVVTAVQLTWNARESDDGCPRATEWVLPGSYTVVAAALGGEPAAVDFRLAAPAPETIRVTPAPKRSATSSPAPSAEPGMEPPKKKGQEPPREE